MSDTLVPLEFLDTNALRQYNNFMLKRKAEKTVKAYLSDMRVFHTYTGVEEFPMSQYEETALDFLKKYRDEVAPKTTLRRVSSLNSFAKWANWSVSLDFNAPKAAEPVAHPIPEGIEGVNRMIEVANPIQRALLALCGLCGCRVGEALQCRPSDFDFECRVLTIHGKGSKDRIVPISNAAWNALASAYTQALMDGDVPLIRFSDRYARDCISELGRRVRLKRHIKSHDLRATFATEVYNKTMDIRLVQELLGHSDVKTTQIYTGISIDKMRKAVELND
jgi:site-specific recombinase XerD